MIRVYLGHGAWGSPEAMAPWVEGLTARGIEAHAVTLPRGRAERAVAAFLDQVPDEPGVILGGQSFGGRVASLAVAQQAGKRAFAGLVCLAYPLHRPGHPGSVADRMVHWPRITVPTLLLSGTRDPFARQDLLDSAVASLPRAELASYPGIGHSLAPVRDAVLDRMATYVAGLAAAPGLAELPAPGSALSREMSTGGVPNQAGSGHSRRL